MCEDKFCAIFFKEHTTIVTDNFKTFLDNEIYVDLIFICKNNIKVGAHQLVMGCISKFFYSFFIENQNIVKEKVVYVNVPDIRAKTLKLILEFIYCGKAMLNMKELKEFNDNIKLLGMPVDIQTEITKDPKKTLEAEKSSTNQTLNDIRNTEENTSNRTPTLASLLGHSDENLSHSVNATVNTSTNVMTKSPTYAASSVQNLPPNNLTSFPSSTGSFKQNIESGNNTFMPVISSVIALDPSISVENQINSMSNNNSILSQATDSTKQMLENPLSSSNNLSKNDSLDDIEIIGSEVSLSASKSEKNNGSSINVRKRPNKTENSIVTTQSKHTVIKQSKHTVTEQPCINLDESDEEDNDIITIS